MEEENVKDSEKEGLPGYVLGIIVAVVVVVGVVVVISQRQKFEPVVPGTEAHNFTLPNLDGEMVSLEDFDGKVVFLNFWASWCKPCEEEMPSMQELYDALGSMPFEIVAVSIDTESSEAVKEFADKYDLTFPILHDKGGKVKELYKTTGVPETFIVDQNGVIAEKVMGPRDWSRNSNLKMVMELLRYGPKEKSAYEANASKTTY